MAVFLLMQVALRGREWSFLTGERRGKRESCIATTIYSLCLGLFCNEMACVMEAISKQWAYSTWRGVSVRTGPNTIPPFYHFYCSYGHPPSFLFVSLRPPIEKSVERNDTKNSKHAVFSCGCFAKPSLVIVYMSK